MKLQKRKDALIKFKMFLRYLLLNRIIDYDSMRVCCLLMVR